MDRLAKIEKYLKARKNDAKQDLPSLFHSFGHKQSFAVRFHDSSPSHKKLQSRIERLAICRFKQKGDAAEHANNVFHHLTYEGAVDVAQIADKRERHAVECQINEFGQCPRQIFAAPHPRRLHGPTSREAMDIAERCMQGSYQL